MSIKLFAPWTWAIPSGIDPSTSTAAISSHSPVKGKVGAKSTIHTPTLNAIIDYCKAMAGENRIGIGVKGDYIVVENNGTIVAFSQKTHRFFAESNSNGVINPYELNKSKRTGKDLILALIPVLYEDEEFRINLNNISEKYKLLNPEDREDFASVINGDENLKSSAFILCDNAYRRIGNDVEVIIPPTGNIPKVGDYNKFSPEEDLIGSFELLAKKEEPLPPVQTGTDLNGRFPLDPTRVYSEEEQALIPSIEDWYIVPDYVKNGCKLITASLARPVRNLMLRGEAGTGKTEAAKAMAAALNLPYVSLCCHPDMAITDFLGTILPKVGEKNKSISDIPSFEDIEMDPVYAYEMLTGDTKDNVTADDVLLAMAKAGKDGVQYEYCDSPLIKGIKEGYLVELQEPAIIERPGVLAGLNSLLDTCQSVTLPTGEVIKRHPDCVIVITTNTTYQGCKEINNSVISRMQFKVDTELPSQEDLASRIMGITGFKDINILTEMVKVVNEIHTLCQERMIEDGSCGVRELIDWVQTYMVLSSVYDAAMVTVIPSATADPESQQEIINACLLPHFTK